MTCIRLLWIPHQNLSKSFRGLLNSTTRRHRIIYRRTITTTRDTTDDNKVGIQINLGFQSIRYSMLLIPFPGISADYYPAGTLCNDGVVITLKRHHFDVMTSKWRRFDVTTTLLLHHIFGGYMCVVQVIIEKLYIQFTWKHLMYHITFINMYIYQCLHDEYYKIVVHAIPSISAYRYHMVNIHWKSRVVIMPTLSPLVPPKVVVITSCDATDADKAVIMKIDIRHHAKFIVTSDNVDFS